MKCHSEWSAKRVAKNPRSLSERHKGTRSHRTLRRSISKPILLALLTPTLTLAQQPFTSTPLQPATLRSWGDSAMRPLMSAWEAAFRVYHPEITFQDTLLGSATSMAGIITNTSDLSLMGRPADTNEIIGFEWVYRVKPLGLQVANGALQAEDRSPALAVLVNRDNPIQQISLAQLARILGCPDDPTTAAPTWSLAGATGPWATRPVHAYLYDNQTGTGAFLMQAIQGSKDCWNWSIVHEFTDTARPNGSTLPAAQQIADALQHDPDGLAISTLSFASPSLKPIPIAASDAGRAIPLTAATITAGTYPLARGIYIYVNRPANMPLDPKVREFLTFILGPQGQAIVKSQGDFLPLNPSAAAAQLRKLE